MANIPVFDVEPQHADIYEELASVIARVVASGSYILGPNVTAFEEEIGAFCNAAHAVGVASGTDALHLALRALRVGPGDEVITTAFTFVATVEAILLTGAKPVFVDIDPKSLTLDHQRIESAITSRTKAILPVHLYGYPCQIDAIVQIAESHRLKVIEDCAQAFGAKYDGKMVGTFGDVGCLSFFPTKNLGCIGDGGMIITNDEDIYLRAEMLRRHGGKRKYYHEELGLNSRLDELQAAILRTKLPQLDKWNLDRCRIAEAYDAALTPIEGWQLPPKGTPRRQHVYHQYSVQIPRRDEIRDALLADGIATAVYYPTPLHLQPVLKHLGLKPGSLPVTEMAAASILSLPMYPGMATETINRIVTAARDSAGSIQNCLPIAA